MAKIVIGIVGQIGAGKDTAIDFLEEKGFVNFSLSDQIRIELKKRGSPNFTREEIQRVGNEMRAKFGHDYWSRQAWEKAMASGQDKLVISSIRHPAEVEFLKKQPYFYLLAVIAGQRTRFERKRVAAVRNPTSTRSDDQDILAWEKFKQLDDYETKGAAKHGQQVEKTLALADFTVDNNGTVEELRDKIGGVLAQIKGGESA
jgi:dephospho-CoA kinase